MDLSTFGKQLLDILAQRSLEALRNARIEDVREVMGVRPMPARPPAGSTVSIGATVGALLVGAAIGAGLTALLTPTSGPELRARIAGSASHTRRSTTTRGGKSATKSPTKSAAKRSVKGHAGANGHALRATRDVH